MEILEKGDLSKYLVTKPGLTIRTDKLSKLIDGDILDMVGDLDSFEKTVTALIAQWARNADKS